MNKTKHPFIKNVLTLMSGTAFAQLLSILASPLLSRIFTPEDFALQASFVSVTSLCLVFCSGKIEQAILLPKEDEEARHILRFSIILCSVVCLILPIIINGVARFNKAFNQVVVNKLVFVSIVFVFCSSLCESFRVYFLRHKKFRAISSRTIVTSIATVVLNLFCGYFIYSNKVLITSTTIAQIVALFLFLVLFYRFFGNERVDWTKRKIKPIFSKYWQFPALMMPGQLLNSLTGNLPILVLTGYYSSYEMGLYAFVYKIVTIPMSVIGSSVTQVFLQRFSKCEKNEQLSFFIKTSFILFFIILIPAVICVIFAPFLFEFIFGEKWIPCANLARLMSPFFIFQFAITPVSGAVFIINKKLHIDLLLQLIRVALVGSSFVISRLLSLSFDFTIFSYSISLVGFYLITFISSIIIMKRNKNEN